MAKPELGEKRRCLSCETKYYDLSKNPIVCPKCGAVFELSTPEKPAPEEKVKEVKEEATVATEATDSDPETVSLEEADEDEGETVDGEDIPDGIPDAETSDDDDTDDSFLDADDDDDDDDMSDLVNVTKDEKEDI